MQFHIHDGEPHGQAALLLVESLIHGLIARKIITTRDAVEFVEVAAEARADHVEGGGCVDGAIGSVQELIAAIQKSLEHDIDLKQ